MSMRNAPRQGNFRVGKIFLRCLTALAVIYVLLLVPDRRRHVPPGAGKSPFAWNRDAFWSGLEQQFAAARAAGCDQLGGQLETRFAEAQSLLLTLDDRKLAPESAEFDRLETNLFELAPLVAVCPGRLSDYTALVSRVRTSVKRQSEQWDLRSAPARERLYRVLFGTRMAIEEVMLQLPDDSKFPEITLIDEEPSRTPAIESHGLRLHSGDILVSRGGAPTSALIARGNDFPGSFSHVALLHVDEKSGEASVIESHIECGVKPTSLENYLREKKLRILVLRLRADLPALKADPMLPHKVAESSLREARSRHIPYDFAMDYHDPAKQFCSEVVSAAYAPQGIQLWLAPTFISHPVVSAWLASLGVRHFETQEPADLEQDPQLRVVAEWRDRETLFKAHVDDSVTDVMLESGRPGKGLAYPHWQLPFARLSKAYSIVLNRFGGIGPVPEGMKATEALRVKQFRGDHEAIVARVLALADQFKKERGYLPPYWELLRLAREAKRTPT
jgi:hypothetical protein